MKILLTGANGYIGKRILLDLLSSGYHVVCCVRDKNRFTIPSSFEENISVIEVDFLKVETLKNIPNDIKGTYYLMHSMSTETDYTEKEKITALNFQKSISKTLCEHVVYLSGIINEESLSKHLSSRKMVEEVLGEGKYHLTTLRAGIIIGSGSASFEIIRDLVEKLPIMITPKWLQTRCQPIGITDVITALHRTLFNKETYDQNFDLGGPDILTYKQMLLYFAKARGLKRRIITVPIMTPRLSSYWLYFVTSTSFKLASALVESMKVEVVCRNNDILRIIDLQPISYEESLKRTLVRLESPAIISSWKDSLISGTFDNNLSEFINVPAFGCFKDRRKRPFNNRAATVNKIWKIGGKSGWYYGNWLWKLRGFIDKLFGGVGLRRGRTNDDSLHVGDAVDFWRVLYANVEEGRLLLFAEMKLPGEAWLEFRIDKEYLVQTATFRPRGLIGRLYWYLVLPFHGFIFKGMLHELCIEQKKP
ncbi:MAG: SDR family oxidoreductase [Crocinitomicaceae bacterium]|nr:SDR family oxidoreductase [Crocinitomicaceae bacterium]